MSSLKSLLLLTTVGCFYAKSGDVAACRVVCIGLSYFTYSNKPPAGLAEHPPRPGVSKHEHLPIRAEATIFLFLWLFDPD